MNCLLNFLLFLFHLNLVLSCKTIIKTTEDPSETETESSTTTTPKKWVCPSDSKMFLRTPTEKNNFTERWCIGLIIGTDPISSSTANDLCAQKNGGVLTTFENEDEEYYNSELAFIKFVALDFTMGSITLDGRRKPECINNSTRNVPPCTKNGTFEMVDSHTDPTYIFSLWYEETDQPDGQNIVIDGQYITESCINYYVLKNEHRKFDETINDVFCDYAISPIEGTPIFESSYGAVCGWAPKWQESDVY